MKYGEWTTLENLPEGAIFETSEGVRAVKSEYRYSNENLQCQCILLASGEYAHFPEKNSTRVREIILTTERGEEVSAKRIVAETELIDQLATLVARINSMLEEPDPDEGLIRGILYSPTLVEAVKLL